MKSYSTEEVTQILLKTKDPRFTRPIKSMKKYFSLSNAVYKVDFEDNSTFVIKIDNPENVNLLTFFKHDIMKIMKQSGYGQDLFLYSGDYLEIERYVESTCLTYECFIDPLFRANIMRNLAEFNSLKSDSGENSLWNHIFKQNLFEGNMKAIRLEIEKYVGKCELGEDPKEWIESIWAGVYPGSIEIRDLASIFRNFDFIGLKTILHRIYY